MCVWGTGIGYIGAGYTIYVFGDIVYDICVGDIGYDMCVGGRIYVWGMYKV